MKAYYVSLDNFIVVEDENENMTEAEVIDNAASQITQQLMVDVDAFTWVVEEES